MVSSGHVTLSLPVKKVPLGLILRNLRYRTFSPLTFFLTFLTYFPPYFSPVLRHRTFFPYFFPVLFSPYFFSGQGLFRSRDFVTSGEKGPTRVDIAQLTVFPFRLYGIFGDAVVVIVWYLNL
jgi:hypothetical protein